MQDSIFIAQEISCYLGFKKIFLTLKGFLNVLFNYAVVKTYPKHSLDFENL